MTFDAFGRNVAIAEVRAGASTGMNNFVWAHRTRCESRDSSGIIVSRYFLEGQTSTSGFQYYSKDHLGSVRQLTDSVENISTVYTYDGWGRMNRIGGAQDSDFRYAGYYFHSPSALLLTRARSYSSVNTTFLSRDPIGEAIGANVYQYAVNNPVLFTDPSGLNPWNDIVQPIQKITDNIGNYIKDHWNEGMEDCRKQGPIVTVIGLTDSWDSIGNAQSSGLTGPVDGPQDAYRHCLWSCRMTSHMSEANAKGISDCHERYGYGQSQASHDMDMENNAAGREGGRNLPHCPDSCDKYCHHLLDTNRLIHIK